MKTLLHEGSFLYKSKKKLKKLINEKSYRPRVRVKGNNDFKNKINKKKLTKKITRKHKIKI